MECVFTAMLAVLIGLIPAAIASSKGRSFLGWWVFGAALFIVALPCAIVVGTDQSSLDTQRLSSGSMKKCPYCAELIRQEAVVCRFCGRDIPGMHLGTRAGVVWPAAEVVGGQPAANAVVVSSLTSVQGNGPMTNAPVAWPAAEVIGRRKVVKANVVRPRDSQRFEDWNPYELVVRARALVTRERYQEALPMVLAAIHLTQAQGGRMYEEATVLLARIKSSGQRDNASGDALEKFSGLPPVSS